MGQSAAGKYLAAKARFRDANPSKRLLAGVLASQEADAQVSFTIEINHLRAMATAIIDHVGGIVYKRSSIPYAVAPHPGVARRR